MTMALTSPGLLLCSESQVVDERNQRPVLELGGGKVLVGFKPELYETAVTAR
jgi:hypothetical protein